MIILGHPKGQPLGKAWQSTELGAKENKEVFSHAIKVRYLEAQGERFFSGSIADLFNLADLIEDYQDKRSVCLVRGSLTQGARAKALKRAEKLANGQRAIGGLIYRASDQTANGDVMDTPCHIIPLDLDSVEIPDGLNVTQAIEEVINTQLAPCFRGISYVYQLSGSMGFKTGLRVKLFFTASRAVTQQELRTLWKQERLIDSARLKADGMSDKERLSVIDGALYQRAQMIFISKPHLSGLTDPYPNRTKLIWKKLSVIELPEVKKERERPQITLPRPKLIVEDKGAETALERAVQRLTLASDGRYAEAFTIARYLGRFWTAGRLPESRIVFTLLQAAEANGSISKHGKRAIEKQIKNGIKAALTAEPLHTQELNEYPELNRIDYSPSQTPKPQPLTLPKALTLDHTPSTASEISEEVERVIEFACESSSKIMNVVNVPVGSGKSHHGLLRAVKELNQGRTVIYAADSYALIEEAEEKLKRLAPQVRSHRYEGKLRGCKLYMDYPEEREEINQVIAEGVDIPQLCKGIGCPFWDRCDLRKNAHKRPAPQLEGRLTFTTHAMIPHLDKHLAKIEEEPLILIDESPQLSYFSEATLTDLEALYPTAEELNKAPQSYDDVWRLNHPQSRAFASLITPHLISWVKPLQMALSSPHARDIQPADLAHRLRELEGVIDLAHAMLEEEPQPLRVKEKDDRDSRARAIIEGRARLVKASAIRGLKSLAKLITGEAISVALAYDKTSAWIETGSALKLPERGKVVILDATLNPMRWDLLAYASGRQLQQVKADEEKLKPHLAQGVWIKSTSFSRSKLFKGKHITDRGRAALHNLGELCSQHGLIKGKIGIGTHKQLAELIEEGKQGQGALEAHSISAWAAQEEVKTGYTGRDHRGSNKFEECETLLIIGDPTTNKRRERRVLETLMISSGKLEPLSTEEADQDYQHELESYQIQWIGRGRHIRREGVRFIYVGRFKPTSSSGIIWSKLSAPQGRPPSPDKGHALKMALEALQRGEAITQNMIEDLGVSRKTARGIWKQLVDQDWAQVSKEGRSKVLKASDPNMALIGYPYKDRVICCEEEAENGGKNLYKSKGYNLGHILEPPLEPEPPPIERMSEPAPPPLRSHSLKASSQLALLFGLTSGYDSALDPIQDHTSLATFERYMRPPPDPLGIDTYTAEELTL